MKTSQLLLGLLVAIFCAAPAAAQKAPTPVLDEHTRAMQEYMARRDEWIAVRNAALAKVKEAKDDKEKKKLLDKLADDEKPTLAKMNEAAQAFHALKQNEREQELAAKPNKPATKG